MSGKRGRVRADDTAGSRQIGFAEYGCEPLAVVIASGLSTAHGALAAERARHLMHGAAAQNRWARADLLQAVCVVLVNKGDVFGMLRRAPATV